MVPVPLTFGIQVALRVPPSHRRELLQTLEGLRATLTTGPAAVACEVLEDAVTPNRFFWVEWWGTLAEADASMNSEHFHTLMAAVQVLGEAEDTRCVRLTPVSRNEPACRP